MFFSKHPELGNEDYYSEFPDTPKGTIRYWKMKAPKGINKSPTNPTNVDTTKKSIPPQNTAQEAPTLIDDPNELLMSTAMRELNKANPEVRWANVLLQLLDKTKQLEAKSKSEVQSKLKQYSITELIELRKKLIES